MEFRKHRIWQILKVASSVALLGFVVLQVSFESVVVLWSRISLPWFLASVVALYLSVWSMAHRYWKVIGHKIEFRELLNVVLYQNVMSNLITTTAGAAWYLTILRRKYDVQVANGLLALILARLGDLVTLLLTLSFATVVLWPQIPTVRLPVMLVIAMLTIAGISFLSMLILRRRLVVAAQRFRRNFRLPGKIVHRILTVLGTLSNKEEIDHFANGIGSFAGYSFLTLGMMLLFAYSNLRVFGVHIEIWPVIFVVSVTQMMTLIPIQVFGGLGLHDISYLYLYGLFGVDQAEFATVVVGLRLAFYLNNLVLLVLIDYGEI